MTETERRRIMLANRLGAKGYRVRDIIDHTSATEDPIGMFIIDQPEQSASDTPWYEESA